MIFRIFIFFCLLISLMGSIAATMGPFFFIFEKFVIFKIKL
jgi:hypothetical protein